MESRTKGLWGAAFVALASLGLLAARRVSSAQAPPADLRYQTRCDVVDWNLVDGYVSNLSRDTYLILGEVRFTFFSANSMSRPQSLLIINRTLRPGETAQVAEAKMSPNLTPGEVCSFDVRAAIRRP